MWCCLEMAGPEIQSSSAGTRAEQITCIFGVNRANCDTSAKVGME